MARAKLSTALIEAERMMAEINKEFGEGSIIWGSKIQNDRIPRISSGSLSLDVALGGGWTVNSWHEVYGDESSAKTTLILKTIAAQQQRDPNWITYWVAAEEFVPEWAKLLGVDLTRVMVMQTNVLEEATGAVIKMLESRTIDCVVIDSLPALVPMTEAEHGMDDQQVGLVARMMGKFFRKANTAMRRSLVEDDRPVTGFMVNQWRERIGIMFGDPRTTPGGRAKNFWYFTRVELKRDDWITEGDKRNAHQVGLSIKALVKKNKTAPPGRTAVFDFYFDVNEVGISPGNYDPTKELIALGLYFNVIVAGGGHYRFGDSSWHGRAALEEELRYDLGMQERLRDSIMSCSIKGRTVEEAIAPTGRRRLSDTE